MNIPPLGLIPKKLWDERRFNDISDAIVRYAISGKKVPQEWFAEYIEIAKRLTDFYSQPEVEKEESAGS